MKPTLAFLCLLIAAGSAFAVSEQAKSSVTPVQKVIQLLEGMLAKGKEEKHAEAVQYANYKQFCDDFDTDKSRDIKEAEELISSLEADIEKYESDITTLAEEIAAHEEDISVWKGDIKAATKVRDIEKAAYDKTFKDYSESIDALERAIQVMKSWGKDRKQEASFAQVAALKTAKLIPAHAKKTIDLFLAQGMQALGDSAAPPEANAYEFQSSAIVDMLEKLLAKFTDESTKLEMEELNSKHAFELLLQDLGMQIGEATKSRDHKLETKTAKMEAKAKAEAEVKETTATMEADKKLLKDTMATCGVKATDYKTREQIRTEEIAAIEKAIAIMKSEAVSGNAEKYLPTMLQKRAALAQLRASTPTDMQAHVAQFLQRKADQLHSRILATAATRAAADPFVKVKKMIKDLLVHLMEQAAQEADHKEWCDRELEENEQTRKEKTAAVEKLQAEIDELEASIAKLTEAIAELDKAIAKLTAEMASATELRLKEKAENEVTVKDAQEAQAAVAAALAVLKAFYEKAAESTALVQQGPEIFESPYVGMTGEKGGVIGMLEVIESDFARLETDTKAAEVTGQKEYDEFMEESKEDKKAKEDERLTKSRKKNDDNRLLTTTQKDLDETQAELTAALKYFDKLKPSCIEVGVTYEDRVNRRKEEIASLQEALKILNGADFKAQFAPGM